MDAAVAAVCAAGLDGLDAAPRYRVVQRLETARRRQLALSGDHVARLEHVAGWPPVHIALADVLRITRAEARRRLRDAEDLRERSTLTGQPLPPRLAATATAWHDGVLDVEHLRVIQRFHAELPEHIAPAEVDKAEVALAAHAAQVRPDQRPSSPTSWPSSSTPTARSPSRTGPAGAGSAGAARRRAAHPPPAEREGYGLSKIRAGTGYNLIDLGTRGLVLGDHHGCR